MKYHTKSSQHCDEHAFGKAVHMALRESVGETSGQVLIIGSSLKRMLSAIDFHLGGLASHFDSERKLVVRGVTIFLETKRSRSGFTHGIVVTDYFGLLSDALADQRTLGSVFVPDSQQDYLEYLKLHTDSIEI